MRDGKEKAESEKETALQDNRRAVFYAILM
jgi:hypothetical protein